MSKLELLKKYNKGIGSIEIVTNPVEGKAAVAEERIVEGKDDYEDDQPIYRIGFDVVSKEEYVSRNRHRRNTTPENPTPNANLQPAIKTDPDLPPDLREEDPLLAMMNGDSIFSLDTELMPKKQKTRPKMVPNRFDIPAGSKWDGIIRGNNYEFRYLASTSQK
jgi:Pre-mRNA-splicing factor of RES complex